MEIIGEWEKENEEQDKKNLNSGRMECNFKRVVRTRLSDKVICEQSLKEIRSRNPHRPIIYLLIILEWIFYFGKSHFQSTITLTMCSV